VDYRWSHDADRTFADQTEAEDWLGTAWPTLVEQGVDEVTLLCGDEIVYGPMSLHPPE
jgi:hypothetical protein